MLSLGGQYRPQSHIRLVRISFGTLFFYRFNRLIGSDDLLNLLFESQNWNCCYLEERAKRGSREKLLAVLAKAPDVEPEEYDRL